MSRGHLGEFEILTVTALLQLGDEAYGATVRREIEERTGRTVSIGAVYTTLGRMEKKGLVRSRMGEPTSERGGRAKRFFEVEPAGREALTETLAAFDRMKEGLALP